MGFRNGSWFYFLYMLSVTIITKQGDLYTKRDCLTPDTSNRVSRHRLGNWYTFARHPIARSDRQLEKKKRFLRTALVQAVDLALEIVAPFLLDLRLHQGLAVRLHERRDLLAQMRILGR